MKSKFSFLSTLKNKYPRKFTTTVLLVLRCFKYFKPKCESGQLSVFQRICHLLSRLPIKEVESTVESGEMMKLSLPRINCRAVIGASACTSHMMQSIIDCKFAILKNVFTNSVQNTNH